MSSADDKAQILFGHIVTLDDAGTVAEAMVIRDGRIVHVGCRSDARAAAPEAVVYDLGDATVLPGFIDTHAHLDTEGLKSLRPSLGGARNIADVLARIKALAAKAAKGNWIVTMPVGESPFYFGGPNSLAEKRMPTRYELDSVAPEHPVCILPPSGYWSLPPARTALNSLALRLNNIDRATKPRVPGVEVEHDERGEPTGIIIEHNFHEAAQLDLLPAVPRYRSDERIEGIRRGMAAYLAAGTTSIFEGHGCAPDLIAAFRGLWERGDLSMRVGLVVSPIWRDLAEAECAMRDWLAYARGRGLGDPMLRICGIHVAYGGEPIAAKLAQYQPHDIGYWNMVRQANQPSDFEELCMLAARFDLRLHTIVVDKLDELVPILERVDARYPLHGRRWVLEHMSASRLADLQRLRALGIGVTLLPDYHLWKVGTRFFPLDERAAELVAPAKQLLELGVPVGAGTDGSPYDPLATVRAMVLRQERTAGRIIGGAACLAVEAALRVMTREGAWFTYEEQLKGQLRKGFYADCVVLGADPLMKPAASLESIERRATMLGGRIVAGQL